MIYCDHNATTPPDKRVIAVMAEVAGTTYGNPSSPHRVGQAAKGYLEESRERVARFLGAKTSEIVFTGSGTEADNLAIFGLAYGNRKKGRHLLCTAVEHRAVLSCYERLAELGWQTTVLPVDKYGMVDPDRFRTALRDDTILASVMTVNNEVGTIQPIKKLAEIAHERGVLFHTDAVQAVGRMPLDVDDLGVDLLALSPHKFYGPKGVGVLYIRSGTPINAHIFGGGQEGKRRSGTENLPAIVGLAEAIGLLQEDPHHHERAEALGEEFRKKLFTAVPDIQLYGHPERRIKSTVGVGFAGANGEALVIALDLNNICVSSGSACSTGAIEPSHVLLAMGYDRAAAENSIRFSFGKLNQPEDIDVMVARVTAEVERLRRISPLYRAQKKGPTGNQ